MRQFVPMQLSIESCVFETTAVSFGYPPPPRKEFSFSIFLTYRISAEMSPLLTPKVPEIWVKIDSFIHRHRYRYLVKSCEKLLKTHLNLKFYPLLYFVHDSRYVVQDDVVTGTLTVRENLMFAADLRLHRWTSAEERRGLVNSLLNDLALKGCADTKVGTELIKGVSGGERKRCNIGMELVTKPKILFLG